MNDSDKAYSAQSDARLYADWQGLGGWDATTDVPAPVAPRTPQDHPFTDWGSQS